MQAGSDRWTLLAPASFTLVARAPIWGFSRIRAKASRTASSTAPGAAGLFSSHHCEAYGSHAPPGGPVGRAEGGSIASLAVPKELLGRDHITPIAFGHRRQESGLVFRGEGEGLISLGSEHRHRLAFHEGLPRNFDPSGYDSSCRYAHAVSLGQPGGLVQCIDNAVPRRRTVGA